MFKKLSLSMKLILSFTLIALLIGVAGGIGVNNVKAVGKAGDIVLKEEVPVVEAANEMKYNIAMTRNYLEEFKGASSVIASDDDNALESIESMYQHTISEFDTYVDAIVDGGVVDGITIIKTDNEQLKDLVVNADKLHNEEFQFAAKTMMDSGNKLIEKKIVRDEAMEAMEKIFDEVVADVAILEETIAGEIKARVKADNIGEAAKLILKEEVPLADMANEIKSTMAISRISIEEIVQMNEQDAVSDLTKKYNNTIIEFDEKVTAILKGAVVDGVEVVATDNQELKQMVEEIDEDHEVFQNAVSTLIAAQIDLIKQSNQADIAMEKLDSVGEEVISVLTAVEEKASEEMRLADEGADRIQANSFVILVMVTIFGLIAGIVLGVVLSSSISHPIKSIVEMLADGSEQTSSASGQVSQAAQQLSQGATEQAASLEEISSSLDEINSMTRENTDNAVAADGLSKEAVDVSNSGYNSMTAMQSAMGEMNESSDKISKIIKTIEEIAFQTNLLALNAAVEAARAGEHGKGFAVVAEEVRNLAQRSAQAAKDTATLIEDNVNKVKRGDSIVKEAVGSLQKIMDTSDKVASIVSGISAASQEQTQGIAQITNAITQMDTVTQNNASAAEESASSAEELSAQAINLKDMVKDLRVLIDGQKSAGMEFVYQNNEYRQQQTVINPAKKIEFTNKRIEDIVAAEELIPFDFGEVTNDIDQLA